MAVLLPTVCIDSKIHTFFCNSDKIMMSSVFTSIQQLQIVYSVILSVPILMMNVFIWSKITTQKLFHNQSMFRNISTSVFVRMILLIDHNVSTRINYSSTLPRWMCLSKFTMPFFKSMSIMMSFFIIAFTAFFIKRWNLNAATTSTFYHNHYVNNGGRSI